MNAPELASHLLALVNTSYGTLKSKKSNGQLEQLDEDVQSMVDASLDALIVVNVLLGS